MSGWPGRAAAPALLAASVLSFGCEEPPSRSGFTVSDSAGVAIAHSASPRWSEDEAWKVGLVPRVEIGAVEGDPPYQLFRVFGAVRLDDGRLVVSNSGTGELRFYDPRGSHLKTVGGHGGGPGEFAEFSNMGLCRLPEDRLLVGDTGNNRLNIFTGDGEFLESARIQPAPETRPPWLSGCFGDGTWLAGVGLGPLRGKPGEVIRGELAYFRYGPDGRMRSHLFTFESRPRLVHQVGRIIHYPYIPLTPAPGVAAGLETAYLGPADSYEIRQFTLRGSLARVVRWDGPQRARAADVYPRYKRASLDGIGSDEERRRYARFYERDLPIPDLLPAYGELSGSVIPFLVVDAKGNLWVQRFRLAWQKARAWDVFDSEGRWLGTVATPDRLRVLEIGEDYVLGRYVDELGVERIRLYGLERRGP